MLWSVVILFCMQHGIVYPFESATTLRLERCFMHERVINDCNWCSCDRKTLRFVCKQRPCNAVDMYGHFNDPIGEYQFGMAGHGSWRTTNDACRPRTLYERDGLLCVCDDDGRWPNPICRDLFRVLHEVEATGHAQPSALHECAPNRLHLYGCNVCLCPADARIDPAACTRYNCSAGDPALATTFQVTHGDHTHSASEVYAECEFQRRYIIGCRTCICLHNNRLLCSHDKCKETRSEAENYCEKHGEDQVFNIDCNVCFCDERNIMYCTTRRCLKDVTKPEVELKSSEDLTLRGVRPPIDSGNCIIGTRFKRDCNTCYCSETYHRKKVLSCTMKQCFTTPLPEIDYLRTDCVEGMVYEMNCFVCRCDVVGGVKWESCVIDSICKQIRSSIFVRDGSLELASQHGYCEPSHVYTHECNRCRCLPDGKVVACSDRVCSAAASERPLTADIVPVRQHRKRCPSEHMYKVGCNFCFCLSNGNYLCTTAKCDESDDDSK